ncbi:hypothetical protein EGH67_14140 [Klebsiella aerogenes]|uniref:Uncharacterized protein n=1 Tax=Klebsiella aerogenes (strain ATCC 13048 / DSM 30053 / CCUG 1429 / JCM 1235 / KCTC 2190 / NBRC 13534 / NCIMB 10102 / NCTC 10006 / CDC 819-56) TaxID=1028307 RepID=A0A0H3FUV1_KLEAK|nr:hypothetical protein EAE_23430 [Klebsiella aerogenes KCTC 2190]MBK1473149.1 hypothetical protein [Klebsiella aerogenes]QEU17643.1 hypothetical protein FOB49_02905 [Klebsiella aerogenes]QGT20610.1 hypothetical protein GIY02_20260 [Klebsiella aerogenes]QGT25416.1 hypothetical protein GIY01_20230 [Klebsiella aerogenes]
MFPAPFTKAKRMIQIASQCKIDIYVKRGTQSRRKE